MNKMMAVIAGLFWPLGLLVLVLTGKLPKTPKALQDEVAQRDARIKELENELGIGQ